VATGAAGGAPAAPAQGTLGVRIRWPEQAEEGVSRSAKMIPTLAQSIKVWLEQAGQPVAGGSTVINKGPGVLLGQLSAPVGSYILKANALDQRDGVGTVLAGNAKPVTIVAGPNPDVGLALASVIANFEVVPSKDEPAFGDRVDLTGVATDNAGNAVLLPVDSSVRWEITGDLHRPEASGRAVTGAPQYDEHAIAMGQGAGTVRCTFVEGQTYAPDGTAQNVTRTITKELPIAGWQAPVVPPGQEGQGPRRIGYDPCWPTGWAGIRASPIPTGRSARPPSRPASAWFSTSRDRA